MRRTHEAQSGQPPPTRAESVPAAGIPSISVTGRTYADEDHFLLTVREAAALMRIGRDMTYAMVADGRIPSVRLGRHIRIPKASLLEHLDREAQRHGRAAS